jgi:hypothetical protein
VLLFLWPVAEKFGSELGKSCSSLRLYVLPTKRAIAVVNDSSFCQSILELLLSFFSAKSLHERALISLPHRRASAHRVDRPADDGRGRCGAAGLKALVSLLLVHS